jgi:hypothetical protein
MLRLLTRTTAFLLLATAFVMAVVDATRSIADQQVALTPLGQTLFSLFPRQFPVLEPAVTRHVHPFLWDPVLLNVLLLPTALVAAALALMLFWLTRTRARPIGFSNRD